MFYKILKKTGLNSCQRYWEYVNLQPLKFRSDSNRQTAELIDEMLKRHDPIRKSYQKIK